ncbi:hypothetical protein [Vibrio sp. WXL210]|uniref:hypothetical protein n=1 Tax=Vibrio sp. WXL210 TaxID=3450709 RepID=UPI003EC72AA7
MKLVMSASGIKSTMDSLNKLADKKGSNWKRAAFLNAGYKAFQPTMARAKMGMPVSSKDRAYGGVSHRRGFGRSMLRSTGGKFSARGYRVNGARANYAIYSTLDPAFNVGLSLSRRKGNLPFRYPFMLEVGRKNWRPITARNFMSDASKYTADKQVSIFDREIQNSVTKASGKLFKSPSKPVKGKWR